MKFPKPLTPNTLAELLGAKAIGNTEVRITGLNEIHAVERGDLVFVDHPKYYEKALKSDAIAILIDKEVAVPKGKVILVSDDPFKGFNQLIEHYQGFTTSTQQIHPTATIGEGTIIQPNVFIGANVHVGKGCIIHANATINHNVIIGDNVTIHSNAVIGGDGFYYQKRDGVYHKFNSGGDVILGDDVEIGANSTIDRGVTSSTRVGKGTKVDNLVHIGHDCTIGENCLFAAQVGIAGCCTIGNNVTLWGQVGVIANINIEDDVVVYGQSGVGKSLSKGNTYFGSPAEEAKAKYREIVALKKLIKP